MADIELVIKISKEDFEIMKHNIAVNNPLCPLSQEEMVSKVAKGIPLPMTKEQILQAGYEGREVRFYIGGRLFAIRELAQ